MKKLLAFLTAAAMLSAALANSAAAAASIKRVSKPQIQVLLDGKKMSFADAKPFSDSSKRVLVPIRFISEALGAKVDWNSAKSTVNISMNKKEVTLVLGQSSAKVNGVTMKFDTQAVSSHSRIFVPLRFVSEALGQTVNWDSQGSWVWIGKKEVPKIEDVTKLRDIKNYVQYFSDSEEYLVNIYNNQKFNYVRLIDSYQFPIKMGDTIIYDMWLVSDGSKKGIQMRYKGPRVDIYYLTDTFKPRPRNDLKLVKEKLNDESKIASYYIETSFDETFLGDRKYKSFSLKEVDYIMFTSLKKDDSIHLLLNPFK